MAMAMRTAAARVAATKPCGLRGLFSTLTSTSPFIPPPSSQADNRPPPAEPSDNLFVSGTSLFPNYPYVISLITEYDFVFFLFSDPTCALIPFCFTFHGSLSLNVVRIVRFRISNFGFVNPSISWSVATVRAKDRYLDRGIRLRLSKRTTTEGLREAFAKFGEVVDARVVTDRVSGYSKGFGFVRYATLEDAAEGIKGMDGKFLDGWVIFAEYARPRPPLPGNNAGPPSYQPGYGSQYGRR
ncbi:hypothetical protein RHSIM_RhsimUnG0254600 [Rhododendron simsii]|uniref:RRM domain-containing protein n=1 Tax=Rhododendron simsii TaxID=118357 RepID=A0A834FV58_RHOSS|nr:hypothetical protein RHSIM_RhsimUnG0254600 [Rhododendron simsii]